MGLIENNDENVFGNRLSHLRNIILKKTQKDFSEFIGIPQPTLSAYESGKNKPSIDVVINIADKCNISVDWLCGRDASPRINSMGDFMAFIFELFEAKEFSFKTTIHDRIDIEEKNETDDAKRNWIQLMFYHNDSWHNPNSIYDDDVCTIIKNAYEMYSRLSNYDYPYDYYESRKREIIDRYSDFPITKNDFSNISEEDRLKKRDEIMLAQWESMKNNK